MWKCTIKEGPLAYPFFIGHDVSTSDGSIQCTAFTYEDLLHIEATGARAVFKALEWIVDVP